MTSTIERLPETAANIAHGYADTIRAIDLLTDCLEELELRGHDVYGIDARLVSAYLRGTDAGTYQSERALMLFEDIKNDIQQPTDVAPLYLNDALEVVLVAKKSLNTRDGWSIDKVQLLLAYGGPTVRVTYELNNGPIEVQAYWGGDEGRTFAYSNYLANYLNDLADRYEDVS